MKKIRSLIRLMKRNRKKLLVGDTQNKVVDCGIKFMIAIILAGVAFWGGLQIAESISGINLIQILKTLFVVYTLLIIVFSFVNIINSLYMSDEIIQLLIMPFSEWQIVGAEVICEIKTALVLSAILLFPFSAAFSFYANKNIIFYAALIITVIVLPIFTICTVTSVIIFLFKICGIFKSRNLIKFFGSIAGIMLCFIFITVVNNGAFETEVFSVVSVIDQYDIFFPAVFTSGLLLTEISFAHILEALGITVASILIMIILTKLFYLNTALNMKESNGKRKTMELSAMVKKCAKKGSVRCILKKDVKVTMRTPAYLITGYFITYGFPLLVVVISIFEKHSFDMMNFASIKIINEETFIPAAIITVLYTIFITGMNAVAMTPLSREGQRLFLLKQMPLSAKQIMNGKLLAALFVCGIPTVGYFLIAGIVLLFLQRLKWYYLLYDFFLNIVILIYAINFNTLFDVLKPVLDWGEEAEMLKAKGASKFLWIFMLIFMIVLSCIIMIIAPSLKISAIIILFLLIVLDTVLYIYIISAAKKKMQRV